MSIVCSNCASGKALQSNGFVLEGVIRKAYEKDGSFYDKVMYGFVRGVDGEDVA